MVKVIHMDHTIERAVAPIDGGAQVDGWGGCEDEGPPKLAERYYYYRTPTKVVEGGVELLRKDAE